VDGAVTRGLRGWWRSESGQAVNVEVLMYAGVLALLLAAVWACGRVGLASMQLGAAANDMARAASLERDEAAALAAAERVADADLANRGLTCEGGPAVAVEVDFGGGGEAGLARVEIGCELSVWRILSPVGPGGGWAWEFEAAGESPVDAHRA
jgi:hypothetical protein